MRDHLRIHDVEFTPASARQRARGVFGFVALSMNGDVSAPGFTVLVLPGGRHGLRFPTRQDRNGKYHAVLKPRGPAARASIERQVFAELRRQGVLP